jgi:hypothetical protein
MLLQHPDCFGIRYESRAFFNLSEPEAVDFINSHIDTNFKYFIEKTPTNVYKIDILKKYWPESKIIACIRNPLDVIASLVRRGFTLEASIHRYVSDNQAIVQSSSTVYPILYENLINDPVKILSDLCNYLNIQYEQTMLEFHKNNNLFFNIPTDPFNRYKLNTVNSNDIYELDKEEGINHRCFRNLQLKMPLYDGTNNWKNSISLNELSMHSSKIIEVIELLEKKLHINLQAYKII